jgi:16S rRNA (cytosine967-C5)-methyltransferase
MPAELAADQRRILEAAGAAVRPGGVLVYSTCTISPAENEQLVDAFLASHDEFALEQPPSDLPVWDHPTVARYQQTLPHRDGTDGFFIARMRRG